MNKVLIADDEPNNRLLLQEILEEYEEAGLCLLYAVDGDEALKLIQAERPELVFLDVMLPGMDGLDICRAIKSRKGFESIFIAILTAKSQDEDKRKAREVKADLYITKPFKTKTIVELVKKVFNYA
jgi:CheY-like chemotaxis protein